MKTQFQNYFKKLLGDDNAYFDDIHKRAYSYDATRKSYLPDGVLFPRDEKDVSEILKFCNENQIIIIPRGSGSGFTGGALAVNGGLVFQCINIFRRNNTINFSEIFLFNFMAGVS